MNAQGIVDPYAAARNRQLLLDVARNRLNLPLPQLIGIHPPPIGENLPPELIGNRHALIGIVPENLQSEVDRQQILGEYNIPNRFYANRATILLSVPHRHDYEIKPQLIGLVKKNIFNGHYSENPMDHVQQFEDLCDTTKANGVPEDYLKLTLFKFSLGDKATRWLRLLAPGSIMTWEQCRDLFINHFYPESKTIGARNKISTFMSGGQESFFETWDRFRGYLKDCPHHGFSDENLMNIFYDGVGEKYKIALDIASKCDFSTNTAG